MANTFKTLFRGAAPTGSTTLYTVPSSTTTLVTSVIATNTAGTSATFTLSINGVVFVPAIVIPANDSIPLEPKQAIPTGQVLAGFASAATVNFHITGLEIT